jgi:hypothetical protein
MLQKLVKSLFLIIGISSLVLGFIGIFLPVLPTTPFILLAAYCFAKSSERFHRYIMKHKLFGRMVSDFYERKIIPVKTKIVALTLMWATLFLWRVQGRRLRAAINAGKPRRVKGQQAESVPAPAARAGRILQFL